MNITKINHINYQNFLLGTLVLSGAVKPLLSYYNFSFDITLLAVIAILVDIFFVISTKKIALRNSHVLYLCILLLFYIICLGSLLFTMSETYVFEKFAYMHIPVLGLVYPLFIGRIDLLRLYKLLFVIVLPVSLWFIIFKLSLTNSLSLVDFLVDRARFKEFRKDYLNLGYLLAVIALLSIRCSKKSTLIFLISSGLMLLLGSRGALLFLFIAFFVFNYRTILKRITSISIKKRFLRTILFFVTPLLIIVLFNLEKVVELSRYGINRFFSLINFYEDNSSLERIDQYSYAIDQIFTLKGFFLGYGLGSWGVSYAGLDKKLYPHNIFIEAWFELGVLGMLLLTILFVSPFVLKRNNLVKMIAFFALLNALKSSSFAYDRNLFIFFGILIFTHEKAGDILRRSDSNAPETKII